MMPPPEELRSPRLLLRPLAMKDAEGMLCLYSDPRVTRHLSRPPMTGILEAEARIRMVLDRVSRGEALEWGLVPLDQPGEMLCGTICLFHHDAGNRRAELGFVLASEQQGRGLMREAAETVLDLAFGPLQLERLEADTDPRNTASWGLLERLGFLREGLLRRRWCVAGEWSDSAFYGLLREDWSRLRNQEGRG